MKDRKPYEKPAVIHTEKLQGRAINCNKNDDATCSSGGAIQS
jgi:hypothetical protein